VVIKKVSIILSSREATDALASIAVEHHHDFKQFVGIYYESPEQIAILNATAPGFFADLHRWLIDRIVLNVRKMLDRAETMGKTNLTVPALHQILMAEQKYPVVEAQELIALLRSLAARVEAWRHHLVAHIDRETALNPTGGCHEFVPSEISEFYKTLEEYLGLIYRTLWDIVHPIDAVSHSDAHELMRAVCDATVMADLLERDARAYDALQRQSRFGRK
jgi:hypothetical protein